MLLLRISAAIAVGLILAPLTLATGLLADERDEAGPYGGYGQRVQGRPRLRPGFGRRQQPAGRTGKAPGTQTQRQEPSVRRPAASTTRRKRTPPMRYSRTIRNNIRYYNRYGLKFGNIKLFAKEGYWGPAVKVQRCYGDNVFTLFDLVDKGEAGRVWFQYQDATHRRRRKHRWIMVDPGMLMRGQHIFLRAQSSKGSDIISIKVKGSCINTKPHKY